jgi:integrase
VKRPALSQPREHEKTKARGAVTANALRHSCASWLVAKGLPTRMIADFLGAGEQMILDHYGHLAPGYQQEAARAIGRKRAFRWGKRWGNQEWSPANCVNP